jgi:hypothetical protein
MAEAEAGAVVQLQDLAVVEVHVQVEAVQLGQVAVLLLDQVQVDLPDSKPLLLPIVLHSHLPGLLQALSMAVHRELQIEK